MSNEHNNTNDPLTALKALLTEYELESYGVHLKEVPAYRQAIAAIEQAEIERETVAQVLWKEHATLFAFSQLLRQMVLNFEGIIDTKSISTLYGIVYGLDDISSSLLQTYELTSRANEVKG